MLYPHQILLKNKKVKTEDFPPELKQVIEDLEADIKLGEKQELIPKLKAQSLLVSQRIYDYHVEEDDQTVDITVDTTNKDIETVADDIATAIDDKADQGAGDNQQGDGVPPDADAPATEPDQIDQAEPALAPESDPAPEAAIEPPATPAPQTEPPVDPVATAIAAGADPKPSEPAKPEEPAVIDGYNPTGEEASLHGLYQKGSKVNITKDTLKGHGIDTGFFGKLSAQGGRWGRYRLTPSKDQKGTFNLTFK